MTQLTHWARRLAFLGLGLAVLYGIARLWIGAVASSRLDDELARIRAAGEPLTLRDASPPVPEAENAAPLLQAAWTLVADEPEAVHPFEQAPATAPEAAAAAAATWVEGAAAALDLVEKGLEARPRCRFGPPALEADLRFEELPGLLRLSRLLSVRGHLAARRGDGVAALADARRLDLLGERVAQAPLLIHRFVGSAMQQVGVRVLEAAVGSGRPPAEARTALERHLAAHPAPRIDRAVMLAERAYGCALFDRTGLGRAPAVRSLDPRGDSPGSALLCALFPGPALTLDQVRTLRLWTRALPLAGRPWSEVGTAWTELSSSTLAEAPWYARFSGDIVETGALASRKLTEAEARRDLARLALRVEAHEASSGALPTRLDDLGPEVVPLDPVSGAPFAYRATDGGRGYVVYGFGANRRDDAGAEEPGPAAPGADDVAFRRPPR